MDSPCIKQTVCKVLKIFQYGKYLVAYVLKRVLPESLERKYFSVHIAIFYKFAFHSCIIFFYFSKLRHDILFIYLFILFFTKCTVLNGDVANNNVLGL